MTAKNYALVSGKKLAKEPSGQAGLVLAELRANPKPRSAKEIDAVVGPKFTTRQDTLRVTLYYLLVFKSKGLVRATEPSTTPEYVLGMELPA